MSGSAQPPSGTVFAGLQSRSRKNLGQTGRKRPNVSADARIASGTDVFSDSLKKTSRINDIDANTNPHKTRIKLI